MSLHPGVPYPNAGIGRALAQRWHALAESRLNYLTELFESGRWRRFHSEVEFLENIQEAKDAVERWRAMVEGEAAAVRRTLSSEGVIYHAPRAEPQPVAADAPRAPVVSPLQPVIEPVAEAAAPVLIPIETLLRQAPRPRREAAVTPADLDWQKALDPLVMSARYPMLRTAI